MSLRARGRRVSIARGPVVTSCTARARLDTAQRERRTSDAPLTALRLDLLELLEQVLPPVARLVLDDAHGAALGLGVERRRRGRRRRRRVGAREEVVQLGEAVLERLGGLRGDVEDLRAGRTTVTSALEVRRGADEMQRRGGRTM